MGWVPVTIWIPEENRELVKNLGERLRGGENVLILGQEDLRDVRKI